MTEIKPDIEELARSYLTNAHQHLNDITHIVPTYHLELDLTSEQIVKVLNALEPHPYEVPKKSKDHKG